MRPIVKRDSYARFDAEGLVEIGCMDCSVPMVRRHWTGDPPRARMIRTRHFHQQDVVLENGSTATIFRCESCSAKPLNLADVSRQIRLAWVEELTATGASVSERARLLREIGPTVVKGVKVNARPHT